MTIDQLEAILLSASKDASLAQRLHDNPEAELKVFLGVPAHQKDIDFFHALTPAAPATPVVTADNQNPISSHGVAEL
jgi:hypothetical protein